MRICQLTYADRSWLKSFFAEHWGSSSMVYGAYQQNISCDELPGFAAWKDGQIVGLVTWQEANAAMQIVSLDSLQEGGGVGTALMKAAEERARERDLRRIWLLTTNDNLNALRFYQKRGFELVAVHRHAVDKARNVKPSIPKIGYDGIPLQDELELEKLLDSGVNA
ncbi:GNAT family N-acetyltransferase [Brevibacillus nitrificans]|uniref:GNAT family N-acetyltransferase n=1 Tax=Brevibacillus nitrificans TaxID=651560 RepID=UPI002867720A|nr:GNAT family N-acetyltransferase [Brevibacillus nitrificans]MDR7314541.1 DNA-3-methyladenine glycosylase I [Brevibacillus nitrificans]